MQINKQPAGFTLIEVLIAVVILSIGLLGMAGIQLQGLRGTTSSTLRSDATILANDIAERIHANTGGVTVAGAAQNTHYSDIDTSTIDCNSPPTLCSASPGTPVVAACALAGGASAGGTGSMAESDIFEFACGLNGAGGVNAIPGGFATITCNSAGCPFGSELTVNVNWAEVDPNGDPNNQTVTMVFVP